jgi:hypothetical protein
MINLDFWQSGDGMARDGLSGGFMSGVFGK